MSAHERMYRMLLRAYPAAFRADYGPEMELVFRDQRRAGTSSDIRLWVETVWDVTRSAPPLRLEAARVLRHENLHVREGTMKTMASLATLIGATVLASALTEGWTGGLVRHDGRSLIAGTLGIVAGTLLLATGIGLLRSTRHAAVRAESAAIACLGIFALMTLAAPRMSTFTNLLGFGFPIALLLHLRRTRLRGPSATGIGDIP
jgi:hypothetical protein